MADTIREQIIQDLKAQVEKINTENGYNTNIGSLVVRGLALEEVTIEDTPAFSFLFPGAETTEKEMGVYLITMPVEIDAVHTLWTTDTDGNLTSYNASVLGEQILGDLIQGVIGNRSSVIKADEIAYTGGGIEDYPGPEDQVLWVRTAFDVRFAITIGDPYSQP